MTTLIREINEQLYQMRDPDYKRFQASLMPGVAPERILGVRVPALRRLAKDMIRDGRAAAYLALSLLPHKTYEEDCLHAFLIEGIADYDACVSALVRFLPYVDNWAVCDMMSPPVLGRYPARLWDTVRDWLASGHEFTVRYGLVMLMRHFLGASFSSEVFVLVSGVTYDGYYVKMAAAWLMAEALARHWDDTFSFLRESILPLWIRKKAVQKALESRKLTDFQKEQLRMLREELKIQ